MRRLSMLLVGMMGCASMFATGVSVERKWSTIYVKEHLYYHLGDELNVVDINIEWPEAIDYSAVKPLQQFISKKLFQVEADNLKQAYTAFKKRFGEPVTHKFDTLPDDRKYCYVDCSLKQIAHNEGRFISYRLSYVSSPASLSSQPSDTVNILFTYDVIHDRVLMMKDILRENRVSGDVGGQEFFLRVINGTNADIPDDIGAMYLTNACLYDKGMLVDAVVVTQESFHIPVSSAIGLEDNKSFFSKASAGLFNDRTPVVHSAFRPDSTTLDGRVIANTVDTKPAFQGGMDSLQHFLSLHVKYPDFERFNNIQGSVLLSFVVDERGQICDIRVIRSVSPAIDREAVRVLGIMPRWVPARKGDMAVPFEMNIPISFQVVN